MLKKIVLFCFLILQLSCAPPRNEFKQERFKISRFSLKPAANADFYKKIDTSSVYVLSRINDGELEIQVSHRLKFYANGRVGLFRDPYNNPNLSMNPKTADMGVYNSSNGKIKLEFMTHSAQNGYYLSRNDVFTSHDTLTAVFGVHKFIYLKKQLPKSQLIYKPDW